MRSATTECDHELVAKAASGERAAFDRLAKRHRTKGVQVALKITRDASRAEDVAQVALQSAWRNLATLQTGDFGPWFRTIVHNEALRQHKAAANYVLPDEPEKLRRLVAAATDPVDADYLSEREMREETCRLRDAVYRFLCEHVPPRAAEVYCRRTIDNFDPAEIAADLGIAITTVSSQCSRAGRAVRKLVRGAMEGILPPSLHDADPARLPLATKYAVLRQMALT